MNGSCKSLADECVCVSVCLCTCFSSCVSSSVQDELTFIQWGRRKGWWVGRGWGEEREGGELEEAFEWLSSSTPWLFGFPWLPSLVKQQG